MNMDSLKDLFEHEEGRVPHAYQDHLGYWTIGIGHLIDKRKGGGLPDHIIDALLEYDLQQSFDDLNRNKPFWQDLTNGAQGALVAMCFQLGWPALSKFKNMWAALLAEDYAEAARHALDSKWARDDTPERAVRVAAMMES